jgi:hypothetical protein
MKDFKDVTSTTFGLLIAYLLPGLTGLYSMSFVSERIAGWFNAIFAGEAPAALSVMLMFAAIVIGLQLSVARTLLYECVICRDCRFDPLSLKAISQDGKFAAFRMLIDEQYRYHQFWGAMSFVQPLLFYGWISTQGGRRLPSWVAIVIALVCEAATIYAAIESLKRYTRCRKEILA